MKNKKNAFTLVEVLAVVVILGISFMFIIPSLTSLVNKNEKTEIELIEEIVLVAAKEYANNYNASFYKNLVDEGDSNYIYKSELLKSGLINDDDVSKLNNFVGVKGELLANDKVRYTVEYIDNPLDNYSLEELYFMIQNNSNRIDNIEENAATNTSVTELTTEINNLQGQIDAVNTTTNNNKSLITTNTTLINQNSTTITNMTNKSSSSNVFLKNYPVGSIYVSVSSTNPGELFGGSWEQLKDRFLLGAGSTYAAGSTGGEAKHLLTIDEIPAHWHGTAATATIPDANGNTYFGKYSAVVNAVTSENGIYYATASSSSGGSQAHNNMPPYLTVYMWKRTA